MRSGAVVCTIVTGHVVVCSTDVLATYVCAYDRRCTGTCELATVVHR